MAKKPTQAEINLKLFEALNKLTEKVDNLSRQEFDDQSNDIAQTKTKKRGRPKKNEPLEEEFFNPVKTHSGKVSGKGRPNKFLEMMNDPSFLTAQEKKELEKDKKIDKKLKGKISPRNRQPAQFIDINCVKCNRSFNVSRQLVRMEEGKIKFTCNDCIGL